MTGNDDTRGARAHLEDSFRSLTSAGKAFVRTATDTVIKAANDTLDALQPEVTAAAEYAERRARQLGGFKPAEIKAIKRFIMETHPLYKKQTAKPDGATPGGGA